MTGIQYISQGSAPEEHLQNIENVCKAGVKWVQLRLKNIDDAKYLSTALACRAICDRYEAIMIVNDKVSIAKAAQADGVHLGLEDMNPVEARKTLGNNYIIGGTANTLKDCLKQAGNGVDYIGLGPFRYTETKKKLSPVLGIEGYQAIISEFKIQYPKIPVLAIGGIQEKDITAVMKTGIHGIAVSGMLTNTQKLEEKIKNMRAQITQPLIANS